MITITKLNESFIYLTGYTFDEGKALSDHFSFLVNGFQFMRLYKEGFWDGRIRLFRPNTGQMNIGMLRSLKKYFKEMKIQFKVSKQLVPIDIGHNEESIDRYFNETVKWCHTLRPDQLSSIYVALKLNKAVIESPTGSGKSLILFMINELLWNNKPDSKTLLIVPTTSLVEQMRTDFMDYAINYKDYDELTHIIYSGKEKETDKNLIISTWQSMKNMPKKYFHQFDNVLIDEAHGINQKSKEVSEIVNNCINAKFKIGCTGTIDDGALNKMMLEGLFGPIYKASTTKELIDKGILSSIEIKMILLNYSEAERKHCRYFDIKTDGNGRKKKIPMTYFQETDYIRANEKRMDEIVKLVKGVDKSKNVLLLFKSLDYGKKIYERLQNDTNKKVFYIAGATDVKVREEIRKYSEDNSNIVMVASQGVFSVGINIKKLHVIVLVESMKSKIKTLQSIGRGLRLHDTKDKLVLYDIVDNLTWKKRHNYVMAHCLERIKIYDREKFDYNEPITIEL